MNECLDLESRSELGNAYMSHLGVCYRPYYCPRPPPHQQGRLPAMQRLCSRAEFCLYMHDCANIQYVISMKC